MSKDKKFEDLVSLSMKNFDQPSKYLKLDENGVFCEVTWEDFFKIYDDPRELEDFMADREQDTPRDIELQRMVCCIQRFNYNFNATYVFLF